MAEMPRPSRHGPPIFILAAVALLMSACVHGTPASSESLRYATLDAAAHAAAMEIKRRNRTIVEPAEWGFNLFRSERGYFAGIFHTDGHAGWIDLRVRQDAIAAGHSHNASLKGGEAWLSPWDLGPHGILQTQERLGRLLPHYLVTPAYRLKVWEWGETEQRWMVRRVARSRWGTALASR